MAGAFVVSFALADLHARPPVEASRDDSSIDVVKAYLHATHARDFYAAYPYISSIDRRVRDKTSYLRSQQYFSGFALEVARRLTADMEMWVIERRIGATKARFEVGYRLPTGDEVSTQLLDWNPDKLNALSATEQSAIVKALEKVKKSGKMITLEGRDTFDLVLEKEGWKIFLDWRSRHRVVFKSSQPRTAELAVKFLRSDFWVKTAEPFQVDFKVTNRTAREMMVKLNHVIEPGQMEKSVDMIACGSRLPFRLGPRQTQEISSAYLLRGRLPAAARVSITYDFNPAPTAARGQRFAQLK